MFKVKIEEKGRQNWRRIAGAFSSDYDIFVGLPNTGQRYPYRAYEYGPQKKSATHKKQSPTVKVEIDTNPKEFPLVSEVAFWDEFGSADGKNPERSYLRATIVANARKYMELNVRVVQQVFSGASNLLIGLQKIGIIAENDVKLAIKNFEDPPNAPSTVKRKGVNAPLKYKGTLQQSIRSFVKKK